MGGAAGQLVRRAPAVTAARARRRRRRQRRLRGAACAGRQPQALAGADGAARAARIAAIKAAVPFGPSDEELWAPRVGWEAPLGLQYGEGKPQVRAVTRGEERRAVLVALSDDGAIADTRSSRAQGRDVSTGAVFTSRLSGKEACAAAARVRARLRERAEARLGELEQVSSFAPEPNKIIVRWKYSDTSSTQVASDSNLVTQGSTIFRLDSSGKICACETTWGMQREALSEMQTFYGSLWFAWAARPPGGSPVSAATSFQGALKLAAWEAGQDNPDLGGQLSRSELDELTDLAFWGAVALATSFVLLFEEIARYIVLS